MTDFNLSPSFTNTYLTIYLGDKMQKNIEKERKILNGFTYFFIIVNLILACIYMAKFMDIGREAKKESELLNLIEIGEAQNANGEENDSEQVDTEDKVDNNEKSENNNSEEDENVKDATKEEIDATERMFKVGKLQEGNEDIVGWIEIEETNINYPVLQGNDNEYYLTHNYKKEKSQKGSIFLDAEYDWSIPSNNLLIYGHNIMNDLMFKDLLKYADKEFYKEHPVIRFTTKENDGEYEIISAFKSKVFNKSDTNVFRYYNFMNAETEAEYNEFVENSKKASLYDIEATAEYGDELITLITCSYHTTDGRFVVIGREKK